MSRFTKKNARARVPHRRVRFPPPRSVSASSRPSRTIAPNDATGPARRFAGARRASAERFFSERFFPSPAAPRLDRTAAAGVSATSTGAAPSGSRERCVWCSRLVLAAPAAGEKVAAAFVAEPGSVFRGVRRSPAPAARVAATGVAATRVRAAAGVSNPPPRGSHVDPNPPPTDRPPRA